LHNTPACRWRRSVGAAPRSLSRSSGCPGIPCSETSPSSRSIRGIPQAPRSFFSFLKAVVFLQGGFTGGPAKADKLVWVGDHYAEMRKVSCTEFVFPSFESLGFDRSKKIRKFHSSSVSIFLEYRRVIFPHGKDIDRFHKALTFRCPAATAFLAARASATRCPPSGQPRQIQILFCSSRAPFRAAGDVLKVAPARATPPE
jgi:hypothetical protein